MSNAKWGGVLLRDVLMYSGLLTPQSAKNFGVHHVCFKAVDGVQASIPIEKALSPYVHLYVLRVSASVVLSSVVPLCLIVGHYRCTSVLYGSAEPPVKRLSKISGVYTHLALNQRCLLTLCLRVAIAVVCAVPVVALVLVVCVVCCTVCTRYGDVLLAYEMNDKPLPPEHGGPLRIIVPGHVGIRNIKWVQEIQTSPDEVSYTNARVVWSIGAKGGF